MSGALLTALTDDALAPLFWPPARVGVDSAWYGHVPFAHWIVAAHRPASIVELGAHNGVSYAAFCEAVLRERIDASAIAVDTWKGDEHAGFYGEDVHAELRRFHDQRYAAFSTLLRNTFDEALKFVPDGSVDLLHIDGRHRYEDVSHDFATWRAKLSPRAVVLFHDTNVREHDFGVWRLWSELRTQFPSFEFLHGHGLGVLAVGTDISGPVAALTALGDGAAVNSVRERFAALGERWIAARDLLDQQRLAGGLHADLAKTKQWAETAQGEVNKLFPLYKDLVEHHRAARANLAQARFDIAARELRLSEQRAGLEDLRLREAAAQAGLAAAREQILTLEAQRSLLLGSASWRMTAPVRRAIGLLRGRGLQVTVAPAVLPGSPAIAAAEPAFTPQPGGEVAVAMQAAPRALFISGEGHTPGHIYRVERYVAIARQLGWAAHWMEAAPVGPEELQGVRLVVIWREPYSAHIQGIVDVAHQQGAVVIFDVDDLMFRPEMAVVEIIDGIRSQKFSELETQAFFTRIGRTLKACDVVTCPTLELAHHARRLGRAAYVLPNGFDDTAHAVSRRARREWRNFSDDLLRIGYAGGSRTHQRDFAVAAPAIARVLREIPQARLTIFRDPSSGEGLVLMDEFPEFAALADQIEWRDMVKLAELPTELVRFAVNIAPLEHGNPFCEAKSELKYFEAALASVPTVASPAGPFQRAIIQGVTGFIAETSEDWYAALSGLLRDAALRARVAQAAYHDSLGRFGPEARARAFAHMVVQAEGGAAGAAAFERDLFRASLPRVAPPTVPDSDVLFSRDRLGDAEVTVIVPVFKYPDYVTETLASVAAQTLEKIDLVVIDDHSPDDSAQMVIDWANAHEMRFNRITLLRHRANAGLGFARNSGFAAAETPFVLPLDADNRLRPDACTVLLRHLKEKQAAFAYPEIQEFGDKNGIFGTEAYSVLRLQRGNYIDAMALVRKSAWAEVGGYDHVQYGWEDFDFWCRLAEHGQFGVNVPEVLADYRVHAASMLHTMTEIRDHKNDLVADLKRRHLWLDVPKKDE
jgi:GT2 family glycosyltransferase/glycosyltransferase involved in cell wall biosynthesis